MARMSIDDMFLRDPRVLKLARRLGWSKYETRGRLLDVFALVYDRVDAGAGELVTADDVDVAADFPGLAAAMEMEDLAVVVRDRVRVCGATERTKYLSTRESSGRAGGVKSGETRRKKAKLRAKVTFEKNEGPSNPSVPDPVPDLVPDTATAPEISPARAIPRSTEPSTTSPPKPSPITTADLVAINTEAWEGFRAAHEELRGAGVDRVGREWSIAPSGVAKGYLVALTNELVEQLGDVGEVRAMHRRVLEVRIAEAKRLQRDGDPSPLKYFIPTRVFDRASWWKSAELTPAQASQSKHRQPAIAAGAPRELRVATDLNTSEPAPHPAFRTRSS